MILTGPDKFIDPVDLIVRRVEVELLKLQADEPAYYPLNLQIKGTFADSDLKEVIGLYEDEGWDHVEFKESTGYGEVDNRTTFMFYKKWNR
jgi:hypothetical protein